jgi:hypothetical protein
VVLFSGLWRESPENGNFSMYTWRLSEISGGIGANIGLHRDSLRMKSPPFAGLSALKKENSLTAGLAGWLE